MQVRVVIGLFVALALVQVTSSAIRTSIVETTVNGLAPESISKLLVQPVGKVKRQHHLPLNPQNQNEHDQEQIKQHFTDDSPSTLDTTSNSNLNRNSNSNKNNNNLPNERKTKVATSRTPAPGANTSSTTSTSSVVDPVRASPPPTSSSSSSSSPHSPPATGANHVKLVMNLLHAGKLETCAGQLVCDLNCDPTRYGRNGVRLANLMTSIQRSGAVGLSDSSFLVTAGLTGRMYYWTSGCHQCKHSYSKCFTDSKTLMQLISFIDLDKIPLN